MKTLILVRHAKASHNDTSLPDRERPLTEHGHSDASMMGRRLAQRHVRPDLIISSPAVRALTTAQAMTRELGYAPRRIAIDERLYASTPGALLAVLNALDSQIDCVMLFGHNPEFSELAQRLSRTACELSTCALAEFRYDTKAWSDIGGMAPAKFTLDAPKQ